MNDKTLKLALPWYRHPWPWLLMLGPFVVVVAGLLTAYIAFKSNDGLVDDDYYRKSWRAIRSPSASRQPCGLAFRARS